MHRPGPSQESHRLWHSRRRAGHAAASPAVRHHPIVVPRRAALPSIAAMDTQPVSRSRHVAQRRGSQPCRPEASGQAKNVLATQTAAVMLL